MQGQFQGQYLSPQPWGGAAAQQQTLRGNLGQETVDGVGQGKGLGLQMGRSGSELGTDDGATPVLARLGGQPLTRWIGIDARLLCSTTLGPGLGTAGAGHRATKPGGTRAAVAVWGDAQLLIQVDAACQQGI